ncbi:MAG: proton-conducting transporter membrane subunit [Clostridia bacterium]|nr:proton-conducting transporter membrane subunit [Clostridia bacterium]
MDFIQNFPFFCIIISLFTGPLSSVLKGKKVKYINTVMIFMMCVLNAFVFAYCIKTGESFVYRMGHFPAPWGNEIRASILEGGMALFFSVIMFFSVIAGRIETAAEVEESKQNLYYAMINLLMCSLIALVYTNDLFTAYVFVEINTISACGLIMIRQRGRNAYAATRYMVMSLLGSGLLLLGLCWLYGITGQLLMSNIKEAVTNLVATGAYNTPLLISICLMVVGLCIKCALFPFHTWLPDAYGYSTLSSAAILSSLVSKGYLFILIKIIYRVFGFDVIVNDKMINVLFMFGIVGMIIGSLDAIRENDIRRMIAYSSIAQIGYIFMGIGLGTTNGMIASIYHILVHAATKSLLFIAASGLTDTSCGKRDFLSLTGSGYRNKLAGFTFTVGSMSMIGFPAFAGFISKLLFAQAGVESAHKMLLTFLALAISTILNAVYFMKTVIRIYTPAKRLHVDETGYTHLTVSSQPSKSIAMAVLIVINFVLGLASDPIVNLIQKGLEMFA